MYLPTVLVGTKEKKRAVAAGANLQGASVRGRSGPGPVGTAELGRRSRTQASTFFPSCSTIGRYADGGEAPNWRRGSRSVVSASADRLPTCQLTHRHLAFLLSSLCCVSKQVASNRKKDASTVPWVAYVTSPQVIKKQPTKQRYILEPPITSYWIRCYLSACHFHWVRPSPLPRKHWVAPNNSYDGSTQVGAP